MNNLFADMLDADGRCPTNADLGWMFLGGKLCPLPAAAVAAVRFNNGADRAQPARTHDTATGGFNLLRLRVTASTRRLATSGRVVFRAVASPPRFHHHRLLLPDGVRAAVATV